MPNRKKPFLLCMLASALAPAAAFAAPCTVPNTISNGQIADASKVMENFNAVAGCAVATDGTPTPGSIAVFSGPKTVTSGNLTGDVTTSGTTATLADTGVTAGTYINPRLTVDRKGRVIAASPGASGGGGAGNWWLFPPSAADFTVNMMDNLTMTMIDDNDVGLVASITPSTAVSGGDSGQYMGKPISNPDADWDLTTRLTFAPRAPANFTRWGLALSNTAKTKRVVFGWDNRAVVYWGYMVNPAGWGGSEQQTPWSGGGYPHWYRITHTASNARLNFYASEDGKGWTLIRSMPDTEWLGETPKFVGFGFDVPYGNPGFDMPMSIAYWKQSW